MLLSLVKYSQPDIVNATKELSKVYDGANPVAYKELLHVIRYIIDTKKCGLRIEPTGNVDQHWDICFSNSDYT